MEKPLTLQEAARILRIHPRTLRNWLKAGKLPIRKLPGTRKHLILPSDLPLNHNPANDIH